MYIGGFYLVVVYKMRQGNKRATLHLLWLHAYSTGQTTSQMAFNSEYSQTMHMQNLYECAIFHSLTS